MKTASISNLNFKIKLGAFLLNLLAIASTLTFKIHLLNLLSCLAIIYRFIGFQLA
jgi:hypothetical protein